MYLQSYKQLKVWQKGVQLAKEVYKTTDRLPKSELYGLSSQMKRCAVSISSNIAEGYKRKNLGEYIQFLSVADGSAAELETQIIIAKEIYAFIDFSKIDSLLEEIQKMLITVIKKLNAKRYTLNPKKAFTMVEMIVALGLFAITLTIASGALIKGLRMQKEIGNIVSVNDNISQAIEQMAREIRTGHDFSSSSSDTLQFTNAYGKQVIYQLDNAAVERQEDGKSYPITANNVTINSLKFILKGQNSGDGLPPRVTVIINVSPKLSHLKNLKSVYQTTISCRNIDT